jgi:voltage-gated potassium channel
MFKKIVNTGWILLCIYLGTIGVGVAGMMTLEGAEFIDALYWASTTITSTGYGDIAPKTDAGKLFAVAFQQWGIVIVLALTIAWILGKVNQDLFSHDEQVDADEDRETIKADTRILRDEIAALRQELMSK